MFAHPHRCTSSRTVPKRWAPTSTVHCKPVEIRVCCSLSTCYPTRQLCCCTGTELSVAACHTRCCHMHSIHPFSMHGVPLATGCIRAWYPVWWMGPTDHSTHHVGLPFCFREAPLATTLVRTSHSGTFDPDSGPCSHFVIVRPSKVCTRTVAIAEPGGSN